MKNRISLWALGLLFTALFLMPQAWGATCTNASFSGNYVANYQFILQESVGVEVLSADGAGHVTAFSASGYVFNIPFTLWPAATINPYEATHNQPQDGEPPQIPQQAAVNEIGQGTYVVNPDCSMTLIMHPSHFNCFAPPLVKEEETQTCWFPIHWDVELVEGGHGFYFITTDQGVAAVGAGVHL